MPGEPAPMWWSCRAITQILASGNPVPILIGVMRRGQRMTGWGPGYVRRVDDEVFARFVGPLDYPMYVLTVAGPAGSRPSGCLVGFATQCSIAPPRFLVCLSKKNHTFRSAHAARLVAVHLLGSDDHDVAKLFGTETGDEIDKFEHCSWTEGPEGVPVLERCSTWFVGRIHDRIDLGDHEGLVLEPIQLSGTTRDTVLMFSNVSDLEAGHPA